MEAKKLYLLAADEISKGNEETAKELALKSFEKFEKYRPNLLLLSVIYFNEGDVEKANNFVEMADDKPPKVKNDGDFFDKMIRNARSSKSLFPPKKRKKWEDYEKDHDDPFEPDYEETGDHPYFDIK